MKKEKPWKSNLNLTVKLNNKLRNNTGRRKLLSKSSTKMKLTWKRYSKCSTWHDNTSCECACVCVASPWFVFVCHRYTLLNQLLHFFHLKWRVSGMNVNRQPYIKSTNTITLLDWFNFASDRYLRKNFLLETNAFFFFLLILYFLRLGNWTTRFIERRSWERKNQEICQS